MQAGIRPGESLEGVESEGERLGGGVAQDAKKERRKAKLWPFSFGLLLFLLALSRPQTIEISSRSTSRVPFTSLYRSRARKSWEAAREAKNSLSSLASLLHVLLLLELVNEAAAWYSGPRFLSPGHRSLPYAHPSRSSFLYFRLHEPTRADLFLLPFVLPSLSPPSFLPYLQPTLSSPTVELPS